MLHGQGERGLIREEGYCDLQGTVSVVQLVRPDLLYRKLWRGKTYSFETSVSDGKVWRNPARRQDGVGRGDEDWTCPLLTQLFCLIDFLETPPTPTPAVKSLFSDSFIPASAVLLSQFPDNPGLFLRPEVIPNTKQSDTRIWDCTTGLGSSFRLP